MLTRRVMETPERPLAAGIHGRQSVRCSPRSSPGAVPPLGSSSSDRSSRTYLLVLASQKFITVFSLRAFGAFNALRIAPIIDHISDLLYRHLARPRRIESSTPPGCNSCRKPSHAVLNRVSHGFSGFGFLVYPISRVRHGERRRTT